MKALISYAMRCFAGLLVVVAFAGCHVLDSAEAGELHFRTDQDSYGPDDDDVELRIENESAETFRVGSLCELILEKRRPGAWEQVWQNENCYAAVLEVEPGSDTTFVMALPDIPGGMYRYRLGRAESTPFTVVTITHFI